MPLPRQLAAGFDYFSNANSSVCCIIMIETAQAVEDLDEIVSVPGIDAVYVGPADLSITWVCNLAPDNPDESFITIDRILQACRRHGWCPGSAATRRRLRNVSHRGSQWSR